MDESGTTVESFVETTIRYHSVWSLWSVSGWVLCNSAFYQDTDVIPFWTSEADAAQHCNGEWRAFKPEKIELEEFINVWLPDLAKDDVLLGVEWDEALNGIELEAEELAVIYQKYFSVSH